VSTSKLRHLTTAELFDRIRQRWKFRHERFLRCPLAVFDEPPELFSQQFQSLGRSGCVAPLTKFASPDLSHSKPVRHFSVPRKPDEAIDSDTDRAWGQIDDWAYRIDGQRPFVQKEFQHAEIREAESGLVNTSGCVPCQGAHRLSCEGLGSRITSEFFVGKAVAER